MRRWELLFSTALSGWEHMGKDFRLFQDFEQGQIGPTLRIYSWKPKCISLGYAQKMDKLVDRSLARRLGWDVVKRPTGGGIVFHNEAEVTYSLVMDKDDPILPKGLVPAYCKISEAVVKALEILGVMGIISKKKAEHGTREGGLCFSYPAEYEVVVDGKKVVGSAQKRGRRALLQQGSIFVSPTPENALAILKKRPDALNAISLQEVTGRTLLFDELASALAKGFQAVLEARFNAV